MKKNAGKRILSAIKRYFAAHYGILLGLVVLCIVTSFLTPNFLKVNNFVNILRQISVSGVLAISLALVLLTGGIDLSVGSTCAACGCVFAVACTSWGMDIWSGMLVTMLVAGVIGIFNGLLVAWGDEDAVAHKAVGQLLGRGVGGAPCQGGAEAAEE